jgi:uncharacterized membrane protein
MDTILNILHVVGAVFIIGPMAILPMTGLRALRAGNNEQVNVIARSTAIFSCLSLVVAVLGFGLVGMADPKYDLSVMTPWVLISIALYVIAVVTALAVVVPALKKAAGSRSQQSYAPIAAGSGITTVLLLAVVVLMVWKP